MMNPNIVQNPLSYKLIYVMAIDDHDHIGMLKIGDASLTSPLTPDVIVPNCDLLNDAANTRIKQYTNTAAISYRLVHTELAICHDRDGKLVSFRDHDVHSVLENSGIHKHNTLNGSSSQEWFTCTESQAISAIRAVKQGRTNLTGAEKGGAPAPYVLRVEQDDAVKMTIERFKKADAFLWNAKMRFGKTVAALTVVKRCKFRRTIIVTHRPVVGSGWQEDFAHVFMPDDHYQFVVKENGSGEFDEDTNDQITDQKNDSKLQNLDATGASFVYFASIQDLRGSTRVGGKYEKNNAVFNMEWDLIIIDEAHEGTQTALGKGVEDQLKTKKHTKLLALSGTPFNIIDQYGDNVYTWDYISEQRMKEEWDTLHPGDYNPYAELPQMHIYTYDLGNQISGYIASELEGKAFNFHEFFRVWTGDPDVDRKQMPAGAKIDQFVHEEDVLSFLNLISSPDENSFYPYATEYFRAMFKHTLWMVPGVKEARALSAMLKDHPIFSAFGIANVAGEGDKEERYDDALKQVRDTIANNEYSITLSCGKLTTGVTVKEWTAVLMLTGSASTAAAGYMQTIFRVQSKGTIDGKQKEHCYVFDFAPDRTLKVLADVMERTAQRGLHGGDTQSVAGAFLNYCPVISMKGTVMLPYDVDGMMGQLKRIFVERAIRSGFDDNSIYDQKRLLDLTELDATKFNELHGIIGKSKAVCGQKDVVVNVHGLNEEEHESPDKPPKKKPTPDELEKKRREELKRRKEERKNAIAILRGISIRMPLLIYGADVPFDKDISIEDFVELVDNESWAEFMPTGVTKPIFKKYLEYYDKNVFITAGREIRRLAKEADDQLPSARVQTIARIFSYFKNPDKETVLTPWRVVNMHMGDILGGYSFFSEDYQQLAENPHLLRNGQVTKDVFKRDARVLEINSKSGLYPLYVAYSIFRAKLGEGYAEEDFKESVVQAKWQETLRENVFVICKTPMARMITMRTLSGYRPMQLNAIYYKKLVDTLKEHPEQFVRSTCKRKTWGLEGNEPMDFEAVVGNPPYMEMDGGNGASATPVYQHFIRAAKFLNPLYISMITPSRWFAGGKGLDDFRTDMLSDTRMRALVDFVDSTVCFSNVLLPGGVSYFLWDRTYSGLCTVTSVRGDKRITMDRKLDDFDIFIRDNECVQIINRVLKSGDTMLDMIVNTRNAFGISTDEKGSKVQDAAHSLRFACSEKSNQLTMAYISPDAVQRNSALVSKYKVVIGRCVPRNGENGVDPRVGYRAITTVHVFGPQTVFTDTYLLLATFDTLLEAQNFAEYMTCRLPRYLLRLTFSSINVTKGNFRFVPFLDYKQKWDDDKLFTRYGFTDEERTQVTSIMRPLEYVMHVNE